MPCQTDIISKLKISCCGLKHKIYTKCKDSKQDKDLWTYEEQKHRMGLTGNSTEVEVFSDDLLELAVH